jgi:hypothetical protein
VYCLVGASKKIEKSAQQGLRSGDERCATLSHAKEAGCSEAMMLRHVVVALAALLLSVGVAAAQIGQFPGVAPPVPSPPGGTVPGGAPAMPKPPPSITPPRYSAPSRTVTLPGYPPVVIPRRPRHGKSYGDRVQTCLHAGAAAGIGPNDLGQFSAQCAQQ